MYLITWIATHLPTPEGWMTELHPCWLTDSGRLTHKVIINPASSLAQDRESSPAETCSVLRILLHRQLSLESTPASFRQPHPNHSPSYSSHSTTRLAHLFHQHHSHHPSLPLSSTPKSKLKAQIFHKFSFFSHSSNCFHELRTA